MKLRYVKYSLGCLWWIIKTIPMLMLMMLHDNIAMFKRMTSGDKSWFLVDWFFMGMFWLLMIWEIVAGHAAAAAFDALMMMLYARTLQGLYEKYDF